MLKKISIGLLVLLFALVAFELIIYAQTTHRASGSRTTVGFIDGKQGRYEVFHRAPRQHNLYYQAGSSNTFTGFRFYSSDNNNTYTGPDGSSIYGDNNVIRAIQQRYNQGRI